MTEQKIFDKVVKHLLTQNAVAMGARMCQYRTEEGLKCAVGCLIKDEFYSPNLEGYGVSAGVIEEALVKSDVPIWQGNTVALLQKLQFTHDHCDPKDWTQELAEIAEEYHLNYNPPV